MSDTVYLSAGRHNVHHCVQLAQEYNLGLELMIFAYPDVLDGDWRLTLAQYKEIVKQVPGAITLHGPFMDMVSGSPDPRVNAVCVQRYSHTIHIAGELGAKRVVFHANFIGALHNRFYRDGWHKRNVEFWQPLAEHAQRNGVVIALENMWEFDPTIIGDVLRGVDHPHLRACLDVGHAHLFGDARFSFGQWLGEFQPWLAEVHMNNNNGIIDEHHGFDWPEGVLDYAVLLGQIRATRPDVDMVLEMDAVQDMRASLHYFNLGEPARR